MDFRFHAHDDPAPVPTRKVLRGLDRMVDYGRTTVQLSGGITHRPFVCEAAHSQLVSHLAIP
jgi:hypothetical protein